MTVGERIERWVDQFLGRENFLDRHERALRLAEEAVELAQACGISLHQMTTLMRRVYFRPVGEVAEEVCGVQMTLLAFCASQGIAIDEEMIKYLDMLESRNPFEIRKKQNDKHFWRVGMPSHR